MKITLGIILLSVIHLATGQNFLIDERDSAKYEIVQVGHDIWFQENLRFITPTSWCAENSNSQACNNGNYYYPTDIISVCPKGWRVPTWKEFKDAIQIIGEHYKLQVEYKNGRVPLYQNFFLETEGIQGLTLLNDTVFFNMVATGWIEGDEWEPQNQTTMWIVHETSNTPQPHTHIRPEQVVIHSHEHNVLDRPKKLRRFSIRCIKCATE